MKRFALLLAALLAVLAGAGWAQKKLDVASPSAVIYHQEGNVQVLPKGGTTWAVAGTQQILSTGDQLKTGRGSVATLVLWEKTVIKLAENTQITLVDMTETEDSNFIRKIELKAGRIWSDVSHQQGKTPTFEVKTQYGEASVRGTSFETTAVGDDHGVQVWDGTVGYRVGDQEVAVPANHLFRGQGARPMPVRAFDPARRDAFQAWSLQMREHMRPLTTARARTLNFRNPKMLSNLKLLHARLKLAHPYRRPLQNKLHPSPSPKPRKSLTPAQKEKLEAARRKALEAKKRQEEKAKEKHRQEASPSPSR